MKIGNYTLVGGGACPEQYEVYNEAGKEVAYMRLRHGYFTVEVPFGGVGVYSARPNGDGFFEFEERTKYLTEAVNAIDYHLASIASK